MPALLAFGLAALLTWRFCHPGSWLHILDEPNERSLHSQAVPRSGGVAVVAGILAAAAWNALSGSAGFQPAGVILLGMLPVTLVSFLDDRGGLGAGSRLLVHLLAALWLLLLGLMPARLPWPGVNWEVPAIVLSSLALLFIVWMINLYNFMDGMDGFAGGMAVIGFTALALLGHADPQFSALCLSVAAAALGFLLFNFPPARIFLGDTGSSSLGLLAAACCLWAERTGLFPLWLGILVFSPFIVDASVTLLRRLARGERIWQAHRQHAYQRLVAAGWGHRRTVLAEYALMLACAASALAAQAAPAAVQQALLLLWLGFYAALLLGVEWLTRRGGGA
ncbi:MAG TPA: glycosyltransferase family 4 protein [Candidatus Competibacteraceae bacterium]|nr:glycosyltransferase family 4 protein [Candidatus Competibacteraceae bacterium]